MNNNSDNSSNSGFDDETKARIARMTKRIAEPVEDVPVAPAPDSNEKVGVNLALWPEDTAAVPTELTRVSLFGLPSDRRGARPALEDFKLPSRSDITIHYSGKALSAKDETAYYAALRIGRGQPMGQRIYLNKADLLRENGLTRNGQNWTALAARYDRMSKSSLVIDFVRQGNRIHMTTGLLKWGYQADGQGVFIRLDPDSAPLFENLAYQPWEVRLSLKTDIAARLLTYVSGHKQGKPHWILLDSLREWLGFGGRLRDFRGGCETALEELEEKGVLVQGKSKIENSANGLVASWVRTKTENPPLIENK